MCPSVINTRRKNTAGGGMRRWWGSAITLNEQGGIWVQAMMKCDETSVRKDIPETGDTISPGQRSKTGVWKGARNSSG